MNDSMTTFFTFSGNAEEAINYYVSIFPNSEILELTKYENDGPGAVGTVLNGTFTLNGQQFMAMDMAPPHAPEFTWGISILINCNEESEFNHYFEKLSSGGIVMMGPEPVMNLRLAAWVTDKFGVTWQLVFA